MLGIPVPGGGVAQDPVAVSRRYFSAYRLVVASVFLLAVLMYDGALNLGSEDSALFIKVGIAYWLAALWFAVWLPRTLRDENAALTLEIVTDIVALTLMMHASGGAKSGLAFMLIVSLAGAALIGQGRLTLFFAALASIAILCEQAWRAYFSGLDASAFLQTGLIAVGFFATAIVMRLLARRVIANERLARERGEELHNLLRISQRVVRDMADGVIVVDRAGSVRLSNRQAGDLLGIRVPDTADLGTFSASIADAYAKWDGAQELVWRLRVPGGGALRVRFLPAGDGGDALVYLEDLGRLEAQARQIKLAALGRLTAGIAHEIRNPLSAISHAAELLREERRAEMQVRLTRIINDNVQRLERMVKDVLDLGRRDRAEPELLVLQEAVENFLKDLCTQSGVERERFDVDLPQGVVLRFDRGHLDQVLWNLVTNALRYAGADAGAVRLFARTGGETTELHVVDNGQGIGADAQPKLFEPFFTTHSRGTGLGLYIARELCDANGALLEFVDNAPGAHFRITGRNETWPRERNAGNDRS